MKKKPIFTSLALLLAAGMPAMAVSPRALSQFVNLELVHSKTTVGTIIQSISQQTGYEFSYDVSILNKEISDVSVNVKNERIENVLDQVFNGTGISYRIVNNRIFLKDNGYINDNQLITKLGGVNQQSKKITGTVVDATGMPVIGANVMVKGTTNGTITDMDGKFSLEVEDGAVLQVSYIGFANQEIKVGNQSKLSIALKEDAEALDELVVVGYGTQKKVNLTGSVAAVNTDDIQDTPASSLSNALVGKIAGVLMTQSGGKPGAGSSMTVRAQGTWNNTEPLYVIDGVIRDKFAFDGLDASEVANVSVLKDAASAAVYGARAANGVVLVTTKKGKIGKPVISYTGSIGISDATKIPETQNAYNQAVFINDNLRVENVDPSDARYYTDDELAYFKTHNYNWLDEAWEQPLVTRHSLNVSGGNEKVRYFVGGSYYYETGSFENLSFKKYNLRSNIEANITKDLIASLNLNMDLRNDHKPYWRWDNDNDTMSDLYKGLLFRTGQVSPYVDGKPTGTFVEWHPIETIQDHAGYNRKKYSNYEANISLQYNAPFLEGLSFKLQYNK